MHQCRNCTHTQELVLVQAQLEDARAHFRLAPTIYNIHIIHSNNNTIVRIWSVLRYGHVYEHASVTDIDIDID